MYVRIPMTNEITLILFFKNKEKSYRFEVSKNPHHDVCVTSYN